MTSLRKFLALFVGGLAAIFGCLGAAAPESRSTLNNPATLQQETMPLLFTPAVRLLAFFGVLVLLAFGFHAAYVKAGLVVAIALFFALDAACARPAPGRLCANSPGALVGANIIQKALEICFLKFPSLKVFGMGFKDLDGRTAGAVLGQDVTSRILTPSSVSNFGTAPSDFTATDVSGRLRNYRQIYHKFLSTEINSTDRRLIDEAATPMAIGLASEITRAMAAMVCRTNFNATVNGKAPYLSVASGWTYANTLLPFLGLLNDRGVPKNGQRYLLVNSNVNVALLADSALYSALNSPQNAQVIATGELPAIVTGLKYDDFPAISPTDSNLIGFGGTPDALTYLARAPKTPDEVFAGASARAPFTWGIITDEKSGFSVLVQQWIDTDMNCHTRLVWLDGYSVGNTRNLVRLINGVVAGTSGVPVAAAVVTNPGYGYVNGSNVITAPDVTVVPVGAGSGATAVATVDTVGAVTGITVSGGTGYTSGFTLTIAPVSGGSTKSAATAVGSTSGLN